MASSGQRGEELPVDIVFYGIVYAFLVVVVSFLFYLPGVSGWSRRLFQISRLLITLFIGASILLSNFGYGWESGQVTTQTRYKALSPHAINATIGLHIGLRGINITLKGEPVQQLNETIDYNEHFSWMWLQGVVGFGGNAGSFNQAFRAAQARGVPLPIQWVAEYLTYDGGYLRFGRYYRRAGYYAHIVLWAALPLWLISNVLIAMTLKAASVGIFLTGLFMLLANIIYGAERNQVPLDIPFENGHLTLHYSWCFGLCLATGIACILLSILFFISLHTNRFAKRFSDWFILRQQDSDAEDSESDDRNNPKRRGSEAVRRFKDVAKVVGREGAQSRAKSASEMEENTQL